MLVQLDLAGLRLLRELLQRRRGFVGRDDEQLRGVHHGRLQLRQCPDSLGCAAPGANARTSPGADARTYNFYLSSKIKTSCDYNKALVIENAPIYAFIDIVTLGSIDMIVLYPWILEEEKRSRNQNYPSKDVVNYCIKSQAVKVGQGTANAMPSPSPPLGETHCCLSFRPLSLLSARMSRNWCCFLDRCCEYYPIIRYALLSRRLPPLGGSFIVRQTIPSQWIQVGRGRRRRRGFTFQEIRARAVHFLFDGTFA